MDLQGLTTRSTPCQLNDLVTDLVEEFSALALASRLSLTANILVHTPVIVIGSEEQLYRLVANLITNAIQYTSADGQISVSLQREEPYGIIQVADTGIGIPSLEQPRIFDRFYRVNSDRSRHTGGSGLGLAIAQAIVQRHQGTLQVESEVGQGSRFTVKLPMKRSRD
jgi:signal transduction histidine kinase